MTLTPVAAPAPPKRPRLTRAVSGPASVGAAPTQITLPLNQLAGLPLAKILSVAGAQAAPGLEAYTLLTSPLPGSELAGEASGLAVLGPQFQLLTLPAALQQLAAAQNAAQQPLGSISLVDVTATAPSEPQEELGAEKSG